MSTAKPHSFKPLWTKRAIFLSSSTTKILIGLSQEATNFNIDEISIMRTAGFTTLHPRAQLTHDRLLLEFSKMKCNAGCRERHSRSRQQHQVSPRNAQGLWWWVKHSSEHFD